MRKGNDTYCSSATQASGFFFPSFCTLEQHVSDVQNTNLIARPKQSRPSLPLSLSQSERPSAPISHSQQCRPDTSFLRLTLSLFFLRSPCCVATVRHRSTAQSHARILLSPSTSPRSYKNSLSLCLFLCLGFG